MLMYVIVSILPISIAFVIICWQFRYMDIENVFVRNDIISAVARRLAPDTVISYGWSYFRVPPELRAAMIQVQQVFCDSSFQQWLIDEGYVRPDRLFHAYRKKAIVNVLYARVCDAAADK